MGKICPLWLCAIRVMPDLAREVSTQEAAAVMLPLLSSFKLRRADYTKMPEGQLVCALLARSRRRDEEGKVVLLS